MPRKKKTEILMEQLRRHLDLPPDARYQRLYHGYWQRSAGAWSWRIASDSQPGLQIGSEGSVKELLSSPGFILGRDGNIYAGDERSLRLIRWEF